MTEAVAVEVSVAVALAVAEGVIVSVAVADAVADGISVGVSEGVAEGRPVAEALGLGDGVIVTNVGIAVFVGDGVKVASTPSTVASDVAVTIGGGSVGCCPGACR